MLKHPAVTPTLIPKAELRAFYSKYASRTIFNYHTHVYGYKQGKDEIDTYRGKDMLADAFSHTKYPRKPRRRDHVDD